MTDSPPITTTYMEGFKCFEALQLDFGALTILTGFNGGGKSTALQPTLLIAQSLRMVGDTSIPLNGPLVRLGTAGDVSPADPDLPMLLSVRGSNSSIDYRPRLKAGDRNLALPGPLPIAIKPDDPRFALLNALSTLSFIGAVRLGTEDSFPIPEDITRRSVGHDGRFAPFWYNQLVDEEVAQARHLPNSEADTFRKQLDAWLGRLFPGAEANVQYSGSLSQMNLQFRLAELGSWRRPSNIGYGLTYAFPILVALLAATPGQVIIIDSPESHLHPSAQSEMGRILVHFAAAGVQIIVESHSDHLLNGVRLAVKESVLSSTSLKLHFFAGPNENDHGVTSPIMNTDGEIYEWPEGFFDQNEKDLSKLAGWN